MEDEKVAEWYAGGDEYEMLPNQREVLAHMDNADIQFGLKTLPLNRTMSELIIQPQACFNSQQCRPQEQVALLPYLTDSLVYQNLNIRNHTFVVEAANFENIASKVNTTFSF